MSCKRILRNSKAISPIFATLILIAIAVIAGVVVYMFTSGTLATMTAGGTAGTEKVAVQGVTMSASGGVKVYAQTTNQVNCTINTIMIKNTNGDIVVSLSPTGGNAILLNTGALGTITYTGALTGVSAGNSYSVTIVSSKGGNFVASGVVAAT